MTRTLRELTSDSKRALVLPGVTNALSAAIAVDIGFEALYLTGAGVTNTDMALPDLGFLSLGDVAAQVGRIRDAVDVPLVVDADTGFGNAVNVIQSVKVLERSGANAIQIEDQIFPKRCGHFAGKEVASLEEMTTKIKAVVDTRKNEDFLVVARTDVLAASNLEEVFRRTSAFAEAGADIIFVEALNTREQIAEVPRHVSLPLLINIVEGGKTPLLEANELEDLGYKIILYANSAMRASILAMQNVLRVLKDRGSTTSVLADIASWDERQRLVNKPLYDEYEKRYSS